MQAETTQMVESNRRHDAGARRPAPGPGAILALIAAVGALVYALAAHSEVGHSGLPLDDSWIHLQFARSLAAGDGLAFEAGALVSGSTAPLWTALLALLVALPGSAVMWSQLLGAVFSALGVAAFYGLALGLGLSRALGLFAAASMVATGPLTWAAVSGLEIPLFILLTLLGVRLHLLDRGRDRGLSYSLPVLALSALARPEGLLLLGLALVDRALAARGQWRSWLSGLVPGLAVAALILVPVALFNLEVSGSLLPTTFAAKSGGVRSLWPSLRYLHTVLGILFRSQPYLTVLAGAGIVVLARRLGTEDDRGLLPALWCVGLPLAYSCLGSSGSALVGNFGRYHYPLFPFVILLGCLGIGELNLGGRAAGAKARRFGLILAGALVLFPTVTHWRTTAGQFVRSVRNVEDGNVAVARWLGARLPVGATLAVNDIGAIKYLLPEHQIYDLAGIVTPQVHAFTRAAVAERRPWEDGIRRYLETVRPDYLVVFPDWFPTLLSSGISFQPQHEFAIAGNIALGGDRLVIYTTPWTRQTLVP